MTRIPLTREHDRRHSRNVIILFRRAERFETRYEERVYCRSSHLRDCLFGTCRGLRCLCSFCVHTCSILHFDCCPYHHHCCSTTFTERTMVTDLCSCLCHLRCCNLFHYPFCHAFIIIIIISLLQHCHCIHRPLISTASSLRFHKLQFLYLQNVYLRNRFRCFKLEITVVRTCYFNRALFLFPLCCCAPPLLDFCSSSLETR